MSLHRTFVAPNKFATRGNTLGNSIFSRLTRLRNSGRFVLMRGRVFMRRIGGRPMELRQRDIQVFFEADDRDNSRRLRLLC
jgi:hypothetical protein